MLPEFSVTQKDGWTVLAVVGDIDMATAPRLRQELVGLVGDGASHIVVDLDGVPFMDSTGLGVLIGGVKRVRARDGELRLVCTAERLTSLFDLTGLTKVFPLYADVDSAIQGVDA